MEVFTGSIVAFGFGFTPYGWAACNGQLLSIAEYTTLYALFGTYYGGNGQTTFGVPDLRGRAPVNQGNLLGTSFSVGQTGGSNSVTLTSSNLPAHNHVGINPVSIPACNSAGTTGDPSGNYLAVASGSFLYTDGPTDSNLRPFNTTVTVTPTGGSQPIDVSDPSVAINYCVAIDGIFPSRN